MSPTTSPPGLLPRSLRPSRSRPGDVTVFDVGGSFLRSARWSPERGLRERQECASPSFRQYPDDSVPALRRRIVEAIADAVPATPGANAGISFGAALDHRTGVVHASAPLWGEHATPFDLLGTLRTRRPDVTWHLVNDVTAALLHYASAPERRSRERIMLVTVSTGIACRVLDRRPGGRERIPVDGSGLQGEIGHLPATAHIAGAPVELVCDCGVPGHVAAYASGPGIRRMADILQARAAPAWQRSRLQAEWAGGASFEDAFRSALANGDTVAGELLTAVTAPLADVVRTALCLDPTLEEVALTGGIATGLGEHYRTALLGHLGRQGLYLTQELTPDWVADRITVCAPGTADGLIGAGLAAHLAADDAEAAPVAAERAER